MLVLIEAVLVGVYCMVLYFVSSMLIKASVDMLYLFWFGVIKHTLGYFLGLQAYWCGLHNGGRNPVAWGRTLVITAALEGVAFMIVGTIVGQYIGRKKYVFFFVLGALMHILAEATGVHAYYLRHLC